MTDDKTVGILGGMGPFATVDFFKKIVANTPAKKDWDHLRIIIDNNTKIPSRTRALLYNETSPAQGMIKSINILEKSGAEFVVVPCNSAHFFYDEVVKATSIPWINIVEVAATAIQKLGGIKPLILGGYITVEKELYSKFIPDAKYLNDEGNKKIYEFIEEIKLTSKLSKKSTAKLYSLIKENSADIDCVVLACTELPIAIHEKKIHNLPVVDSDLEYALATIRYAKE